MKITKAIVSSNDNPVYLDFWPVISKLWKIKFNIEPVLLYFGDNYDNISQKYGTVINMPIIEGIPVSTQAQCSRLWGAAQYGEEVVITSDIDMLPLSPTYYVDSIAGVPDDKFVSLNPLDKNTYFPMCYNVGKSSTMKEILNVDDDWETFMVKLIKWADGDDCEDKYGMGNYWSLDETWTSTNVNAYKNVNADRIHPIPRPNGVNGFRIDRPSWGYDVNLVVGNYYYDSHSLRPYSENKETIDKLLYNSLIAELNLQGVLNGIASHYPVLSELINKFNIKHVMEFGSGFFSTGLFTEKCDSVIAMEMQNNEWYDKVSDRYKDKIDSGVLDIHCIIEDSGVPAIEYFKNEFPDRKYDMVFVDGAGGSRHNCVEYAKELTDIIVCHDTETPEYGWGKIDKTGWVWIDIKVFNSWTSVMTNRQDVVDFVNALDEVDMIFNYKDIVR